MNYILIRTIGVLVTSYITKVGVPMVLAWQTGLTAVLAALVLAIINHTIKPIIVLITLPINFFTLGLFSFVINGMMILLATQLVPGFAVPSLLMAIYFSIVLSVINWLLHVFE
jgi:putative membrane protein